MKYKAIDFYTDTLVVQSIFYDASLSKKAEVSIINELTTGIKEYVDRHMDPEHPTASVLSMIAPSALSMTLGALGFGWWRFLVSLSLSIFQVDVKDIFVSIYNDLKPHIESGTKLTSSQVNEMVHSAISKHGDTISEEDVQRFINRTSSQSLKDARVIKLALIEYRFSKNADLRSSLSDAKSKTTNVLGRVIGWIFNIILGSAGFLVAGDVVNKFLGRPSALDSTLQHGKPAPQISDTTTTHITSTTSQSKFPLNPSYEDEMHPLTWIEAVPNTKNGIINMLLNFTKQVYLGTDSLESSIESSSKFQELVNAIVWHNSSSVGAQVVFIPKHFSSKKQLVDYFITEVAKKST